MPTRFAAAGVPTPALVVDLAILERNIAAMARHAAAEQLALRPHAKTHKSPAIALRQLGAGAKGLAVATLSEAEVFCNHGVDDLFVAYPLWTVDDTARRVAALAARARLTVGATPSRRVVRLARALGRDRAVGVLVEVDCGLRRTGVAPADAAVIAMAASKAGLRVDGVFTFPGHAYAPGAAPGARADEAAALREAAASLERVGIACPVRSGGSTPSAGHSRQGDLTELRPGVYVFNDAQQVALGTCALDDVSLAALSTVVSAPRARQVVLDAGAKVLGPERPAWTPGHGLLADHPAAVVTGLWEHHAVVDLTDVVPSERPTLGDQVALVPNHVCTAVNLARELHLVAGGEVVERVEISAAGANR